MKKRHLNDFQSHIGLYHYEQQNYNTTHLVDGRGKQWTSWKDMDGVKLEG